MTDNTAPKKRKKPEQSKMDTRPINEDTRLLASKLHFTVKDLHYNRHGVVSREQYKRIRTIILMNVVAYAIFFVILGIAGIYGTYWFLTTDLQAFADRRRGEAIIIINGVLLAFMGIFTPSYLLYRLIQTARSMQKLNSGVVQKYIGTLEKRTHAPTAEDRKQGAASKIYVLQFGQLSYLVTRKEHELFKNGATYIVYYLPHYAENYLSVELLQAVFE